MQIRIDGVIGWDITAESFAGQLVAGEDIDLIVNSGGGSIIEGFSMFNALKDHDGKVNVQVDFAGSMASIIALAGDTITMRENSSLMMIHRPTGGAFGRSDDMRKTADTLDQLETMLVSLYMERVNISESELSALLEDETWLNANEAKEIGLIDAVEKSQTKDDKLNLVAGVSFSISKLAAKVNELHSVKPAIEKACSLSEIEGALRDSGRFSRADATALVSRVKAMTHGDRESQQTRDFIDKLNNITVRI